MRVDTILLRNSYSVLEWPATETAPGFKLYIAGRSEDSNSASGWSNYHTAWALYLTRLNNDSIRSGTNYAYTTSVKIKFGNSVISSSDTALAFEDLNIKKTNGSGATTGQLSPVWSDNEAPIYTLEENGQRRWGSKSEPFGTNIPLNKVPYGTASGDWYTSQPASVASYKTSIIPVDIEILFKTTPTDTSYTKYASQFNIMLDPSPVVPYFTRASGTTMYTKYANVGIVKNNSEQGWVLRDSLGNRVFHPRLIATRVNGQWKLNKFTSYGYNGRAYKLVQNSNNLYDPLNITVDLNNLVFINR